MIGCVAFPDLLIKVSRESGKAVERLGGKHMLDECKELRTKVLEKSTVPWNRRDYFVIEHDIIPESVKPIVLMDFMAEEEENYVRMSLLLFGISQRAARVLFDSEFAPQTLQTSISKAYRKLVKLKKDKIINQSQWNLLFPQRGVLPDSSTFDVTLIITLLRHLISLKPPDNGFDKLPSETNSTPSAALATIKYYRNYIAHLQEAIIKTSYFNKAWNNITGAVERLGGKHMLDECKELKTKS
ncbi:unnamed protein product [Mytilus edulis]|uniref:DZIP3-like HEPN domain-containing protein n=1 Tax=Mytilus edulis TaxID=6550 RepID=A0A8S3TU43_MYTED|nr:unnamed protein product [Mytilus edulis]